MSSSIFSADATITVAQLANSLQTGETESSQPLLVAIKAPVESPADKHNPPLAGNVTGKYRTEIIPIGRDETKPASHSWRRTGLRTLAICQLVILMLLTTGVPGIRNQQALLPNAAAFISAVSGTDKAASGSASLTWSEMSEAERTGFVSEQAQHISLMLGDNPHAFNNDAVQAIRNYVEQYARRAEFPADSARVEALHNLFNRASRYAPLIVRAFKARNVPVIVGLYLPMIESDYRACLESPYGAKGLFQFIPSSARVYGAESKDLCNLEKMAPVAARYIADRVTEFGTDARSMSLVLLSFNRSPESVRRDLMQLRRNNPQLDRSFWTLFEHASQLDSYFRNEGRNYVPKFFAAAIVGENPEAFGLKVKPLSSYDE